MDDIPRSFWYRVFEALPGAVSWSILIGPFIASFWFPRAVAIFITMYVLLWFLRSLKSSIFLVFSYRKSRKFETLNWNHLLQFFTDAAPAAHTSLEKETAERTSFLRGDGKFKKWTDIYHVVIIATYKEEKEILETTIDALRQVDYPLDKIILVLATEERDRMRALTNAAYLTERFSRTFGQFHHIMHPANVPGEIAGKGANISHAGQKIAAILKDQGIDFSSVLVTSLDADNRPHPQYFEVLTYHYLMEPKRDKRSFQPLAYFYNNIWEVPFTNRLIALANTFWFLAESGESHHLFNASVYAQSLKMLSEVNFWSRQTIVEDLHQFWRAYFHYHGDHEVIPLFIPVYQDALQNRTYFTSLIGQYRQLRRWAWGASEIPYAFFKAWKHRQKLPVYRTISRLTYLCYLQITWATAPIIILFNTAIPTLLNPKFAHSIFAFNLSQVLSVIFLLMTIGIVISLFMSLIALPRPRGRFSGIQFASALLQWILLPFVTIIYGSIPAIDAQTRLMINKPLGFVVTEKIRKIN